VSAPSRTAGHRVLAPMRQARAQLFTASAVAADAGQKTLSRWLYEKANEIDREARRLAVQLGSRRADERSTDAH